MEDPLHTLLSACRRGDATAQRSLYERYKISLFGICLRYARDRAEAQDFLQDAFLIAFRDLTQYRGEGSLEGWLKKVTLRSILQQIRRKHPLRFAQDYDALPADPTRVCLPDEEMNSAAILRMVQHLPAGYRTVFNLRCMEGFSYSEIAAELQIAESSVRSQYTRACQQLRSLIEHTLMEDVSIGRSSD